MAEPGQQSFEVAPTRIGGTGGAGRPGRRRRLPIALVLAIAVAVPAIAWIGPRLESRPEVDLSFLRPTPTPAPSNTPRALFPISPADPTPLPAVTIAEGEHPTEPFPIDVNGLHLVDPTTGELGPVMELRLDSDAVFTSADGNGWWCVCFNRTQISGGETALVEIRRVDRDGRTTTRQPIGEYVSSAPPPQSDFYTRFDLELAPDGRTGYLVSATRIAADWAVAVDAIDLETGVVSGRVDLGSMSVALPPGPTPPPEAGIYENYLAGPQVRLSPDGSQLLVWAWVDAYSWTGEQLKSTSRAWTIGVDERSGALASGGLVPLAEDAADRLRQCGWVVWTAADEIAGVCWSQTQSEQSFTAVILRPDGSEVRRSGVPGTIDGWFAEPIIDLANRALYLWQPNSHVLHRLDLDTGRTDRLVVDPKSTAGVPPASSSDPGGLASPEQPDWTLLASDMRIYSTPQLIAEPGGSRLFAVGVITGERGYGGPAYASTGVWVFDAREFSLVDRWTAVTAYGSIGLSSDGRWLLAAGQPGADADGNPAQWQSSLTIHDTRDGRPALQLGSLGSDNQIFQIPR
jgi:hypothetical protein